MSSTTTAPRVIINANSTLADYQNDVNIIFNGLNTQPPTDHHFISELTNPLQSIVNTFHVHSEYLSAGHPIVWNDEFMPLKSHDNFIQLTDQLDELETVLRTRYLDHLHGSMSSTLEDRNRMMIASSTGSVPPDYINQLTDQYNKLAQDITNTEMILSLDDICEQYYMAGNTVMSFKVEREDDNEEEEGEEEEEEEDTDTEEEGTQVYTPGPSDIDTPISQGATPGDDDGTEGFGNLSIQDPGHSEA
ncbi:hypothetical protein TREMEDRAFT_59491 [Tremella mesenterica DSM 1558]|uniref:uncharacterized protein n=1 Tax=Tremella mesenterica (strain ATCC 24925 / CBS 8224 / DSM 1558 / NBRC 9311 / NRRL Y-6157 / RJB 2259-6 / UBC 559-6) TaxID=578456 RepID=UPI0003F48DB3|nr:uncharacterized protein TREMEDRAFT_59491 [Tremella mesenterica DSM 1558]EIW73327.1 hypothetical protein TREMEDRAFT_59491 [Tremella mesenterica DSM 1558]